MRHAETGNKFLFGSDELSQHLLSAFVFIIGNSGIHCAIQYRGVSAETHTVTFENNCGRGTPQLMRNFKEISGGKPYYVSDGPLSSVIAFLQTGDCGKESGENCLTVEMTLRNPPSPEMVSSTNLSLIPPHKFNVKTGFRYTHGCDGTGNTCEDANCPMAYRRDGDSFAQVTCDANDVNLVITFC